MLEEPAGPGQLAHQATRDIKARVPGTYPRPHSSTTTRANRPAGKHRRPSDGGRAVRASDPGGGEKTECWPVGGPWGGSPGQHPTAGPATPEVREAGPKHGTLLPLEWVQRLLIPRREARGWGRNPGRARWQERAYLLPATGRGEAAEEEPRTHLRTAGRSDGRPTLSGTAGGRGEPGRRGERGPKLAERSDLGAEGGAAGGEAGGRARGGSARAQEAESAAHQPARALRARAAGPGAAGPRPPR